jgi:hypothetical protein
MMSCEALDPKLSEDILKGKFNPHKVDCQSRNKLLVENYGFSEKEVNRIMFFSENVDEQRDFKLGDVQSFTCVLIDNTQNNQTIKEMTEVFHLMFNRFCNPSNSQIM